MPKSLKMVEDESEEVVRLLNEVSEMPKSQKMAEDESEEVVRLLNEASEMLESPSSIQLPASEEPKSTSYFLTKSLAEMVNEDPIRLENQSCVIREEIIKIRKRERHVYSSLARLPTFSIGLSSTVGKAPLRESSVDPRGKSPPHYFQMPELGARVFVGNVGGFDTITCHLLHKHYEVSEFDVDSEYEACEFDVDSKYEACEFDVDSEYAAVRSLYKDDCPGGLSGWLRAQLAEFWRSKHYSKVILSGTELFGAFTGIGETTTVGNLGGKSSRVLGSDYKDCGGDETIRQPLDIVELPGDLVPSVYSFLPGRWRTVEGPNLLRLRKGSYLRRPEFMKWDDLDLSHAHLERHVIQLTRFDDFVILGDECFNLFLDPDKVIDIVRKNASETVDVIAAQLVKSVMKEYKTSYVYPFTAIVIFLDHKEILLKEKKKEKKENMDLGDIDISLRLFEPKAISQMVVLRDDKEIAEPKEEEKVTTLKEEEKIFAPKMEDKKGIMMEEDYKVKILVGEPLPNVPQTLIASLEENESRMKLATISSNLPSAQVQDDSKASSSIVLMEDDDCNSEEFMFSHHITKWIIYGDQQERTLLCFFNVEEMNYEFYFEDHESMATIIGLGVPHSKVVLEYENSHVTIVEILEEDWNAMWAHSNNIPHSIPEGNVLKQERFPDILHRIANVIDFDNIVSKVNNDNIGGENGKGKAQGNADDRKGKGKAQDYDNHGNTSHPNGVSNRTPDDKDKKERKGEDRNDDNYDSHDQNDGKTSNELKEVKVEIYLRLLPGGVLEEKGKRNELREVCKEEEDGEKMKLGKIHEEEVEEKKKELKEVCEEEEEVEEKEGEGCEALEKKKMNLFAFLRHAFKRGKNGNVFENQQERTTIEGVENGDVDENLQKQVENQIHSKMEFTFTIKSEARGPLKTIQATIRPITFQLPSNNEENYLQSRRFGWFHDYLKVAFGIVDTQVAYLDEESCKVLDPFEAKEVNLQSNAKGNARSSTNAYKGEMGIKHGFIASGTYGRTNVSEAKTTEEVQNTWEIKRTFTHGGFLISNCTDHFSHQLKYSCRPLFPFDEKMFAVKDEGGRLMEYHQNPICQLQQVRCQGTWHPYDSENLEVYKLEASRELRMTRVYNLDLDIREEKQQKGVWTVEKNLPLCFIQKLEKVVYLNHAMSHLTSSATGEYCLQEKQDGSNPSTFLTQGQYNKKPKWPRNVPLVDVKQ